MGWDPFISGQSHIIKHNRKAFNKAMKAGTGTNDLRTITAGNMVYDLTKKADVEKFMQDIADGSLDGKVDYGKQGEVTLRNGRATLKDGVSYDLTKTAGLAAFLKDAKDGKIDGTVTKPPVQGSALGIQRMPAPPAQPMPNSQAPNDGIDEAGEVGPGGHVCAPDVEADSVSYPKPGDLDGWKDYLKENGYQQFMDAFYDNKVDKSIVGDSGFQLLLHNALRKETGGANNDGGDHSHNPEPDHDHPVDGNRSDGFGRGGFGGGFGRGPGIGRGSFDGIRGIGGSRGIGGAGGIGRGRRGIGESHGARAPDRTDGHGNFPAQNDVHGWKHFLENQGYDAFMGAYEAGKIGKEVLSDKELALTLQREQQADTRFWQTMSQMSQNRHQIRTNIIRNLRA